MQLKKIIVAGSTNMDMVVKSPRIPVPGETILADNFFMNPGGKGANQAVTIARLGGEVIFLSKVGNDVFGRQLTQLFSDEGVNGFYLLTDEQYPSGVALITVDQGGENSIVVAAGANGHLLPEDLEDAVKEINANSIILMQLEIPIQTIEYLAKYGNDAGSTVILNPAPMNQLSPELMSRIDIITPNQTEAERLSGIKILDITTAKEAAVAIHQKGVKNIVITLGAEGALIYQQDVFTVVPGRKVKALDSTAAGDVFNGALVLALSEGKTLEEAVLFACQAAALSVTKMGAQPSIPYRKELSAGESSD